MNAAQERHVRLWCTTKLTNATAAHLDVAVLRLEFIKEQPSNSFEGLDVATFMDIIKKSDFAECLVPGMRVDLRIFKGITAPVAPPVVAHAAADCGQSNSMIYCDECTPEVNGFEVTLFNPNVPNMMYPIFRINGKLYCEAKPTDEFKVFVRSRTTKPITRSHLSMGGSVRATCKVDEHEGVSNWIYESEKFYTIFPQMYRLAPTNLAVYNPDDYVPPGMGPAYVPPQLGIVSVRIDVYGEPTVAPAKTSSEEEESTPVKASKATAPAPAEAVHANPPVLTDEDTKFYLQPNLRCEVVKEPESPGVALSPSKRTRIEPDCEDKTPKKKSKPHLLYYRCNLAVFDIFIQDARTIKVLCAQQELAKRNADSLRAGLQALHDGAENGGVDIIE